MASYYIRFDTYYQNSADRFCGPFDSRKAAEKEIERAVNARNSKVVRYGNQPTDIKESVRFSVLSPRPRPGAPETRYGVPAVAGGYWRPE